MRIRPAQRMAPWPQVVVAFIGLNLLDLVSTSLGISRGLSEANLLPSLLLGVGGSPALYGFKAATVLLVVAIVMRLGPRYPRLRQTLWVSNLLLGMVVALNLLQTLRA